MSVELHGLIPVLATPFDLEGGLDVQSLRRLVEAQLAASVDGVALFGMASESFTLTSWERKKILGEVRAVVGGTIPIVAGVNGTSTVTSIEQANEAAEGGADALMVLPPFMVKPGREQILDFYGTVGSHAVTLGVTIMVQDAQGVTGVPLEPSLLAEISKYEGIGSVKIESPPTAPKVGTLSSLLRENSDGFTVLGGLNAQAVLDEYAQGSVGTMPASEFPDLLAPILTSWNEGRSSDARREFAMLLPLINFGLQQGIAWAVHKEVLTYRGIIDHSTVRAPAKPLDDGSIRLLHEILEPLGIAGVWPSSRRESS